MYYLEKLKKEIFAAMREYHISDFVYDKNRRCY